MLVHFEQVSSDLKGFKTILIQKLFRVKFVYFIGNENHFEAVFSTICDFQYFFTLRSGFQYFLRFLKFLTAFWFCAFRPFWLCQRFLNE